MNVERDQTANERISSDVSVGSGNVSRETLAATPAENPGVKTKPTKKMCCACPETKKARDACVAEKGEDACREWIEAHKACLRAEGFDVK